MRPSPGPSAPWSSLMSATYPGPSERGVEGLHGHRELPEQGEVRLGGTAEGREVVADDHRVDAAEQAVTGAEVAEGDLAPAGEPEDRPGEGQPEGRDGA